MLEEKDSGSKNGSVQDVDVVVVAIDAVVVEGMDAEDGQDPRLF